jgi:hypothetical protein
MVGKTVGVHANGVGGGGGFAERKKETLNLKLNTKPLKFKWGLAKGGGGGGAGWSTHARHGYPPPSTVYTCMCISQIVNFRVKFCPKWESNA